MDFDHQIFVSPFSWRYGSQAMRLIWSENNKRRLMRQVWLALATAQHSAGLVSKGQLEELRQHVDDVDIDRALFFERELRHDVMAEIKTYAEQCPKAGGIIHWGATSADITDNVDVLRMRQALQLLEEQLQKLLDNFARRIAETAGQPVIAFTHIQPAEPTTLGYRLAIYAQDFLDDYLAIRSLAQGLKGKGFKGAVGSQASFEQLLQGTGISPGEMESKAMSILELPYYQVTTQTYPRKQDLRVLQTLAGLAATLHKFALDLRLLQSPLAGEWSEPFASGQVGSSAMPFKRNPVLSENICSLARFVAGMPAIAWDNASQAMLERSLDDSANRRLILPQTFLATDEMLLKSNRLLTGLAFDVRAMAANMDLYGPFAASERILMALVSAGANRQEAHEWIRQASNQAWEVVRTGGSNPLGQFLASDERIADFLTSDQIASLMAGGDYVGTSSARAREVAQQISDILGSPLRRHSQS
jgi:adenylosuccinate lyase